MLHRSHAVLLAYLQLVLAGLVGEIADPFSIRRPGWIAIRDRRAVREIADVSLVGRNGEDLPPGLCDHAYARRRQAEVAKTPRFDLHKLRTQLREISVDSYVDVLHLARVQVVELERTELLDHD